MKKIKQANKQKTKLMLFRQLIERKKKKKKKRKKGKKKKRKKGKN